MKKTIILFSIAIFFFACNRKIEYQKDITTIDLSPNSFKSSTPLNLSDIAAKIEYISLETSEKALFGYIYNSGVTFFENYTFLQDKGELFAFNNKGKFLNTIGDIGNGPGEHSKNFQFRILPKEELIAIYDKSRKHVFLHDFSGQFVSEISIDFNPTTFVVFNNHFVFFNAQFSRKDSEYNIITIITHEGYIKKRLLHRSNEESLEKKIKNLPNFKVDSQNVLNDNFYFLEEAIGEEQKNIWELSEDFNISLKYNIEIGENTRPIKDYTSSDFSIINNTFFKYNELDNYIETSKHIFFTTRQGGKIPAHAYIMYDKETDNKFRVLNKIEDKLKHTFVNDIDGGIPFWPFWKVSKNKVVLPIMASRLKKYFEVHKVNDSKVLNQNNIKQLEKLVAKTKETDNPILMVVTLKTD